MRKSSGSAACRYDQEAHGVVVFLVPPGLDLAGYPIVDISDEPLDGNSAQSSASIARGTLSSWPWRRGRGAGTTYS